MPVGKAYFGFTDEELRELDNWVRDHTARALRPGARGRARAWCWRSPSTASSRSTRHKSGLAMRFPRIHRIRWDKPADEADGIETLQSLIGIARAAPNRGSTGAPGDA